jgi:hypothetical protein
VIVRTVVGDGGVAINSCTHLRGSSGSRPTRTKAMMTSIGHPAMQTTHDLYGKLMPGSEPRLRPSSMRTQLGRTPPRIARLDQ